MEWGIGCVFKVLVEWYLELSANIFNYLLTDSSWGVIVSLSDGISQPMNHEEKMETIIKRLLGEAYGWDSDCGELQYLGNPVAFWITDHEAAMVEQAKVEFNSKF